MTQPARLSFIALYKEADRIHRDPALVKAIGLYDGNGNNGIKYEHTGGSLGGLTFARMVGEFQEGKKAPLVETALKNLGLTIPVKAPKPVKLHISRYDGLGEALNQ